MNRSCFLVCASMQVPMKWSSAGLLLLLVHAVQQSIHTKSERVSQCLQVLQTFQYQEERCRAAVILFSRIWDPEHLPTVMAAFDADQVLQIRQDVGDLLLFDLANLTGRCVMLQRLLDVYAPESVQLRA